MPGAWMRDRTTASSFETSTPDDLSSRSSPVCLCRASVGSEPNTKVGERVDTVRALPLGPIADGMAYACGDGVTSLVWEISLEM